MRAPGVDSGHMHLWPSDGGRRQLLSELRKSIAGRGGGQRRALGLRRLLRLVLRRRRLAKPSAARGESGPRGSVALGVAVALGALVAVAAASADQQEPPIRGGLAYGTGADGTGTDRGGGGGGLFRSRSRGRGQHDARANDEGDEAVARSGGEAGAADGRRAGLERLRLLPKQRAHEFQPRRQVERTRLGGGEAGLSFRVG
mmetsp:Transcript_93368/g.251971  ORF Transcript_93368/g.251971 Transcript_93368/m.251971 type:complete len:201 (+) Transcript_93368:566-1168(+)